MSTPTPETPARPDVSEPMLNLLRQYAREQVGYVLACERWSGSPASITGYERRRDVAYGELAAAIASLESRIEVSEKDTRRLAKLETLADMGSLRVELSAIRIFKDGLWEMRETLTEAADEFSGSGRTD